MSGGHGAEHCGGLDLARVWSPPRRWTEDSGWPGQRRGDAGEARLQTVQGMVMVSLG